MVLRGAFRLVVGLLLATTLVACDDSRLAPRKTSVTPELRPTSLARPAPKPAARPTAPVQAEPSQASQDLTRYYARVQNDLLVRGLLRTDGGGPDTAFTDTILLRNFASIALEEEYERGAGLQPSSGAASAIKKWTKPIRMTTEFADGVPADQIEFNRTQVESYAARLGRLTGHPVSMVEDGANFHVLFVSEDDRATIAPRVRQIVPDVNPTALRIFDSLPRTIHCLVIAFSDTPGGYDYGTAIAVIRSEHPDLLRRSCIHEEIAQGFGLGNDDPRARPSIFNDDDEFALLTQHDEMLLRILYNPQLRPGMTAEQALPIAEVLARDLMNGPS